MRVHKRSTDERREQYLLELLVEEVREGQVAKLLNDTVLSALQQILILLVQQAEVSNEQKRFMKKLLRVVALLDRLLCIRQQEVEQVVQLLVLRTHDLLHEAVVSP